MEIVSENQFSGKTYFYTIASRTPSRKGNLSAVGPLPSGPSHGERNPAGSKVNYRVTLVTEYLGWYGVDWVDLDLECSTILLGQCGGLVLRMHRARSDLL